MYVKARPLGGENRCLLGHLAGGAAGSHPQGLLTCHGCVTQEACNLLLTQLLLLVGQQLVEELPEDLLSRCVQNRVHVDDEGVDVPARGGAEAGSSSLRGGSRPWNSAHTSTPTLEGQSREDRKAVSRGSGF